MDRERILLLYLTTGGGHIGTARAFADYCKQQFSHSLTVELFDATPPSSKYLRLIFEDMYRFFSLTVPVLWYIFYYSNYFTIPLMKVSQKVFAHFAAHHLKKHIQENGATRIVSFHFLLSEAIIRAQRSLHTNIPVVTVVTDPFTCHPIWFCNPEYPFVVYSTRLKKFAMRIFKSALPLHHQISQGTRREHWTKTQEVHCTAPIIHSKFEMTIGEAQKAELRKKYNISPHTKLVLITGGGEGMYNARSILQAIVRANLNIQLAVVCGKNLRQYTALSAVFKDYSNIRIYGFVNFMYDLMNMADVIIAKAGPATIFEALLLGKPLIITQKIDGQERGNVQFLVQNNIGWYIPHPQKIAQKLSELLANPQIISEAQKNINKMNLKIGTADVLSYILNTKPRIAPSKPRSEILPPKNSY